jgi:Ca-activated chloride channel family protein
VLSDGVTFLVYEDDPDSPQGRREVTRSAAPAPVFTLPAGTYYVTARTSSAETREQIAIGAGDTVKRTLPLALSRLKLAAKLDATLPQDSPLTYIVVRLDGEPHEVVRTQANEPEFELSAGRYRLEVALGSTNVRSAVEIALAPGQGQKIALKLDAARVTFRLADAQAGDVIWEVRDDKRRVVWRTTEAQPTALLAPGRYVVRSEVRGRQVQTPFELKAGEGKTLEVSGG